MIFSFLSCFSTAYVGVDFFFKVVISFLCCISLDGNSHHFDDDAFLVISSPSFKACGESNPSMGSIFIFSFFVCP